MGFHLTSPAPEKGDPTAEKRVWGFFGDAQERLRGNRPQPKQPRQGNRLNTTKTALGRTYWPSRDPIGERGGINLYGFVKNDGVRYIDILGRDEWTTTGNKAVDRIEVKNRTKTSYEREYETIDGCCFTRISSVKFLITYTSTWYKYEEVNVDGLKETVKGLSLSGFVAAGAGGYLLLLPEPTGSSKVGGGCLVWGGAACGTAAGILSIFVSDDEFRWVGEEFPSGFEEDWTELGREEGEWMLDSPSPCTKS